MDSTTWGDTIQPSTASDEDIWLFHVRCGRIPHPAVSQMKHLNLFLPSPLELPSILPTQECLLLTLWGQGGVFLTSSRT